MTSEECFCNLKIVNLSSKELTEGQIKLLSKGLKSEIMFDSDCSTGPALKKSTTGKEL